MTYKNSYIKEVEKHFLFLIGRGIMLSPKDYDLIMKWKRRGIPKEIIYKGISKALENFKKKKGGDLLPRTLAYCALSIEEEIRNYRSVTEGKSDKLEFSKNDIIKKFSERIAKIISSERREDIRRHYIEARKRVLDLMNLPEGNKQNEPDSNEENIFKLLELVQESLYEDFFLSLPKSEREKIGQDAEGMIDKRSRFASSKARRATFLSFRNEMLKTNYKLKNILSDD
jgi:hypothetical protein